MQMKTTGSCRWFSFSIHHSTFSIPPLFLPSRLHALGFGKKLLPEPNVLRRHFEILILGHDLEPALDRLPTNAYVGVLSGLVVGGGYSTHAVINTGEDTTAFSYTGLSLSPVDGPGVFMSTLSSGSNNAAALRAIYIRK